MTLLESKLQKQWCWSIHVVSVHS